MLKISPVIKNGYFFKKNTGLKNVIEKWVLEVFMVKVSKVISNFFCMNISYVNYSYCMKTQWVALTKQL